MLKSADADPAILEGKRIVVAGYGNQGRPQALNLRESGLDVKIAARSGGESWKRAQDDGFEVGETAELSREADILLVLLPDEVHGTVFYDDIAPNLPHGAALCFAHGFSVAFGEIETADHDLMLVAPKGQGTRLREAYSRGSGLPCLLAVEQDISGNTLGKALAVAWGLGCLRVGAFETTFREEAISDLFGEQAVLCGGVPALIKCAFDVLVEKGFSPEVAYFECFHELKIIVDLFEQYGFSGMRGMISGTAAYGSMKFGEGLISEETKRLMEKLFERIESGEFARKWLAEARAGGEELHALIERERDLPIERAGERIRKLFPKGQKDKKKP
ncbi:MAG: ketol-acid reductoisomerase [Candidatus Krumholzibacteria bacterium]|nr:ketol-acid reductoisomerase [Candidatus Krumholzibacteria bacterium]